MFLWFRWIKFVLEKSWKQNIIEKDGVIQLKKTRDSNHETRNLNLNLNLIRLYFFIDQSNTAETREKNVIVKKSICQRKCKKFVTYILWRRSGVSFCEPMSSTSRLNLETAVFIWKRQEATDCVELDFTIRLPSLFRKGATALSASRSAKLIPFSRLYYWKTQNVFGDRRGGRFRIWPCNVRR